MSFHNHSSSNGGPVPKDWLQGMRKLPCPELDKLRQRFVKFAGLDVMQPALATLVQLAHNNRLNCLNRRGTMLFCGPPGTGKSSLAQLLPHLWAQQTGRRGKLVRANVHALASGEHGESQKNVERLFDGVREACADGMPVFVVLDELETVATDRDEISGKTSPIDARSSVNAFLEQLDHKPPNCILLATTNVPQLLDPAALSRFDFVFEIGLPDADARLKALGAAISMLHAGGSGNGRNGSSGEVRVLSKHTLDELSALTDGFSFREMESLLLWSIALHNGDSSLEGRQLVAAAKYLQKNSSKGE